MKKYIVKIDDNFIKYTSKFGPFYGNIVITKEEKEARLFSREKDAKSLVSTINYRLRTFEFDKKKFPNVKEISYKEITL